MGGRHGRWGKEGKRRWGVWLTLGGIYTVQRHFPGVVTSQIFRVSSCDYVKGDVDDVVAFKNSTDRRGIVAVAKQTNASILTHVTAWPSDLH